jgi:hypothetical protein
MFKVGREVPWFQEKHIGLSVLNYGVTCNHSHLLVARMNLTANVMR